MEELLKKWADRLINFEKRKDNGNNTLFERLECELKIQELKTCFYELKVLADSLHENSGLNIAGVINWVACSEREPDEEGIYYVYPDKYHYTAEYHKYGKWAGKWTVDDQNGYEYETVVKYWKRITPPCL